MKKYFILFVVASLFLQMSLSAIGSGGNLLNYNPEEKLNIVVNNRVLANVNGKPITVYDVMKKMDLLFLREFPEYATSKSARYQFYMVNWKQMLQDLVDKELILADAEAAKLEVSNGDVRQEMENLFGPNIINNLDKVGISFEEAWNIVKGDITFRRMMIGRVHYKAQKSVNPQEIRKAYEQYSKENIKSDEWQYRVISVRDKTDPKKGEEVSAAISKLIESKPENFEALATAVKALPSVDKSTTVNISEEFKHAEVQLSPAYKEILLKLEANSYSAPISQKSRADKSTVYRIFYLKEKVAGGAVPFKEIEFTLQNKLVDAAVQKESKAYLKKLREHFAVSENMLKETVPDDFVPFALR